MNDTDQQAPLPRHLLRRLTASPAAAASAPGLARRAATGAASTSATTGQLRRSHDDKKVGGVAGGVARHLDVDPTIVRVLFVVAIFFGGAGLLVYAVLWLVVPDDTTGRSALSVRDATRNVIVISRPRARRDPGAGRHHRRGLDLLAAPGRDRRHHAGVADGPGPPRGTQADPRPARPEPPPVPSGAPRSRHARPAPRLERTDVHPGAASAPHRVSRRRGPLLFGITLALGALALGVLGLLEASGVTVADGAYPALALTVVGAHARRRARSTDGPAG